ncbi:MAG: hypothetical protein EI684_14725 [Candidatus Viridilinea halotolerans]|uniref:Uncharacterized protein n=1 Tax=Candidatus Viridilinea halotolerans TaxID=2491704 RepID=A0A426TWA1_9CHLR|nr:MAG: hypothetical protein EI684_14725 [Candidatus Viridilinea halotolerans]
MPSTIQDMVPEFLTIVARFADTLVEMDLTCPDARAALVTLSQSPGFARLFAAATEAWALAVGHEEILLDHPHALQIIHTIRHNTAYLDALLSYSHHLPAVQEALAGLWNDPTFAALCHAAQQADVRLHQQPR